MEYTTYDSQFENNSIYEYKKKWRPIEQTRTFWKLFPASWFK